MIRPIFFSFLFFAVATVGSSDERNEADTRRGATMEDAQQHDGKTCAFQDADAHADHAHDCGESGRESSWELFGATGDIVHEGFGGFLFPHLHAFGAFGDSTTQASNLAVGHHDPQREATLQGLEPGFSLRAGKLQGFVTGTGTTDSDGDLSFELEEGFLQLVELPLGMELRGGQFLNRFGYQGAQHNHHWDFVNQNLVNGRFLTEGEMITRGGELTIPVPLPAVSASFLSVSVGDARIEDHGHEDGEHGHGDDHGDEADFEAENAYFGDVLTGVHWVNQYQIDDKQRIGTTLSGAFGENRFGLDSQIYGAGFEYLWRENGFEGGGRSLRWRTEAMLRSIDAVSTLHHEDEEEHGEHHEEEHGHGEHGEHGEHHSDEHEDEHGEEDEALRYDSFDEFGAYTSLVYGFNDNFEAGIRGEWVSGIRDFGLDERWRISPALTWYANRERSVQLRLQYDCDYSSDFGSESSVWFQVGFNFGTHGAHCADHHDH